MQWTAMEKTARKQLNTRHTLVDASPWLILLLLLITACTRTASTSPTLITTESASPITVDQVRVTQGTGVYVSGTATIAEDDCVLTELLENGQPVGWWPKDICVQVGVGRWELLAALGRDSAPDQLDSTAQYAVRAWARAQPDATSIEFPFDLEAPPQP